MDAYKVVQALVLLTQVAQYLPTLIEAIRAVISEEDEGKLKKQLADLEAENDEKHAAAVELLKQIIAKP